MTKGKKITEIAKEQEKAKTEQTKEVTDIEDMEIAQNRLNFKDLNQMPHPYSLALWKIRERLIQIIEKVPSKALRNFLEKTISDIEAFAIKLNEDFTPAKPKHIEDAFAYVKSRKFSGTYIACLDADKNLVKVLIVEKGSVWSDMPSVSLEERPVAIEMNAKFVTIAGTEYGKTESNPQGGKAVSKRVVVAVPFSTDLEKIFEYKNGQIIR